MPEVKKTLEEDTTLAFIAIGELLKKASTIWNEKQASDGEIQTLVKEAADALLENGRIHNDELAGCIEACRDHRNVLRLLKFAAQHRVPSEQPRDVPAMQVDRQGRPAVKQASFRVVGQRYLPPEDDAKDQQWERDIGYVQ